MDIDVIEDPEADIGELFDVMTRDAVARVKEHDQQIMSVIKALEGIRADTNENARQRPGQRCQRLTRRRESLPQLNNCQSLRSSRASPSI